MIIKTPGISIKEEISLFPLKGSFENSYKREETLVNPLANV